MTQTTTLAKDSTMTTLPDAKLFIDGKLRDATGGATFDVISPWTGEPVGKAADATAADVEAAIAAARRAFDQTDWSTNVAKRVALVTRYRELSPHTVWHDTLEAAGTGAHAASAHRFLSELGWREFAWHTLFHFPDLATRNWRGAFDAFPWPRLRPSLLEAWQRGRTGIPLVDAGMRELWATGYMHNRVRMVTASLLTKNLLIDWRRGEEWFWDTLVDADGANNPFNWQWVAGSGADAAPYFRIFNPDRQAERFDPGGRYIAQWAPDSSEIDPIVDLRETRRAALDAYEAVKRAR